MMHRSDGRAICGSNIKVLGNIFDKKTSSNSGRSLRFGRSVLRSRKRSAKICLDKEYHFDVQLVFCSIVRLKIASQMRLSDDDDDKNLCKFWPKEFRSRVKIRILFDSSYLPRPHKSTTNLARSWNWNFCPQNSWDWCSSTQIMCRRWLLSSLQLVVGDSGVACLYSTSEDHLLVAHLLHQV